MASVSSFVEQTRLPKLTVRARGGEPQLHAYVNAYVVGKRPTMLNGNFAHPLYYLSLVAMRGQGTTLQGIFARLVSTHSRDVSIEGIGDVVLAHHQQSVLNCGYTVHWNFEQAELAPTRDLHAVIESSMLTMVDPMRGMAPQKQRESRVLRSPSGKRTRETMSLSTLKKSKTQQNMVEIRNRERHPLFLMMVPSAYAADPDRLQQLHFAFLDQRVPWPLDPSWASFLWDRGIERKEIEPLQVWCYTPACHEDEELPDGVIQEHVPPLFVEAYFCRPQPALLLEDVQKSLAAGQLAAPFQRDASYRMVPHASQRTDRSSSALVAHS